MTSFQVSELTDGKVFTDELFLDRQFLLLDRVVPFTKAMQKALMEWNFKTVYTEGNAVVPPSERAPITTDFENVDIEEVVEDKKPDLEFSLNSQIREDIAQSLKVLPSMKEEERMEQIQTVYNHLNEYVTQLYTRFVTHRELNIHQISETVKDVCVLIKEYRQYVLRISPVALKKSDKNFIISHSVRSLIFAIVIALQLKMPLDNMVELGVAAILHEIGQIRLPPQLYLTDRILSPMEKNVLSTHTILGFNILKENDFPLSIQLGVLEHHERENGKGYPRRLFGGRISLYGKILSVVCSYEALTAPRVYKEVKSTYEAMIEMLRNADKQYDEIVIKALVQALSLFPIGAYVFLSNGRLAQVVDANPNDPRTPIVQIVGEKDEKGNPKIVQTDNVQYKISRVLNKDEVGDILKALKHD